LLLRTAHTLFHHAAFFSALRSLSRRAAGSVRHHEPIDTPHHYN